MTALENELAEITQNRPSGGPRREVFGPTAGDGPAAPPEAEKEKS